MSLEIRVALPTDAGAIADIYNHFVRCSTCTYQNEPDTPTERAAWLESHDNAHPVTVAVRDGEVAGWGALSAFRDRWGYRYTVEDSVYVREDLHGRGVGKALLADLLDRARSLGHHTMIAGVSAEQTPSIALHLRFGFIEVARMREVGHKFEQWLDVVFLQLLLSSFR